MTVIPRSIARPVAILSGLAVLLATATSPAQERGELRPAPRLERPMIPDPPRQKDLWQPPATTLPALLVNASTTLFEQGLADPRGCDYRTIEIVGGVGSDDGDVVRTRGWVLPAGDGERTRFAVAWNGLVYPTASIGEPADLEADMRAIAQQARPGRPGRPGPKSIGFATDDEGAAVSPESLRPVKACLLLRLDRADLAEAVWAAGAGRPRDVGDRAGRARSEPIDEGISYVTLANDLAWALYQRAVSSHVRGDDALALADARKLTAFRKAAEARAEAMGLARPPRPDGRGQGLAPYIGFLGQLPELLADQERRAREPHRAPAPPPRAGKTTRIAALIDDLDQVAGWPDGMWGHIGLDESPIIKALVEAGDDAVDPLIEDLARDARLTRTVYPRRHRFGRDSGRSLTILTAHEAAVSVVARIAKEPFAPAATTDDDRAERGPEGRQEAADRIRAFREKNRGVPVVDRWYRTLADDRAGPGEWLQVAWYIVYRDGAEWLPGIPVFPEAIKTSLPPDARPRLRGESLRAKRAATVAELMARRTRDLDPGGPLVGDASDRSKIESANQMASMLAEWDGQAALPVLKARVDRSVQAARATQNTGGRIFGLEAAIASLTDLRVRAGDPQALDDYALWIRTLTTRGFPSFRLEIFEPLWSHPDHPAVDAAATVMFEDPQSRWNPLTLPRDMEADSIRTVLLDSPLLGLPPFRTLVLRALADRTRLGTVETDAKGQVVEIEGNYRTVRGEHQTSVEFDLPGEPSKRRESPFKPGAKAEPLRVADEVCEQLQGLMGIPHFRKEWPLARRDEAIAACAAFLERYGDRFRPNAASRAIRAADPSSRMFEKAILAFDPLDHPATAEEGAAGRAIFSLIGNGAEVRRIPLPSFPITARWTKLTVFPDEPPIMTTSDDQGHAVPDIEGLQTGRVWQAEEVRQGDGWRRYYGFVGRHALTRVPAEEIEFASPRGWTPVSADLDGRIVVEEAATDGPIPIELSLRNHHGVETAAPSDLVRETGGALSIREGISFRLTRVSDRPDPPFLLVMRGARERPFPPETITVRPIRRYLAGAPPRTLAPAAEAVALRLDLRTLFPIDRPGRYWLQITFDGLKTRDGKPGTVEADFSVVARKTE